MMYAVYNEDGSIQQAAKVYDQPNYGRLLADHAMPYASINSPTLINSDYWLVHTKTEELIKRPRMNIELNKRIIKAGSKDYALFTKIPKQAKWRIMGPYNMQLFPRPGDPEILDATEFQLSIPMPCTYVVCFSLWPYRDYTATIEAI